MQTGDDQTRSCLSLAPQLTKLLQFENKVRTAHVVLGRMLENEAQHRNNSLQHNQTDH